MADPEGEGGGGGLRPSGPFPGSANVHFRLRIQYLRTRDHTKPFKCRIHASACTTQNESGTEMFQFCDESGKIFSSESLDLVFRGLHLRREFIP